MITHTRQWEARGYDGVGRALNTVKKQAKKELWNSSMICVDW